MQETTYTCDRCGANAKTLGKEAQQIELFNIKVVASNVGTNPNLNNTGTLSAQWCQHCFAQTGVGSMSDEVRAKVLQVKEEALKKPTLESVLNDLLYEMVEEAVNEH